MDPILRFILLWAAGVVIFTAMDLVWIGVVAASLYRSQLGDLISLGQEMSAGRAAAALCTWLLLVLGILCFALPRGIQNGSAMASLAWGALLGFVIYGVYDLTNLAVLRGWTLKVTVLDIAWGTFACGIISMLLYGLDRLLFQRGQVF